MIHRCLLILSVMVAASPTVARGQGPRAAPTPNRQVEEIYVSRAVRDSRTTTPTAFCDQTRIGFGRTLFEDRFTFRSIQTRPADGLVVNTDVQTIGNMRVCFGATSDVATLNFHAEGTLAAVTFTGNGECKTVKRDFPESGLTVMRCFLELGSLPVDHKRKETFPPERPCCRNGLLATQEFMCRARTKSGQGRFLRAIHQCRVVLDGEMKKAAQRLCFPR